MMEYMEKVKDDLGEIEHVRIVTSDLPDTDKPCHRPDLCVWADVDHDTPPHVALTIEPLWGEQQRFVELEPDIARRLARAILKVADAVDAVKLKHGL